MEKMPVLWCIGCGDIGSGVGTALGAKNWEVIGVRRHPQAASFSQLAVDVINAPNDLRKLPSPDYVLYTLTPSERSEGAYTAAYDQAVQSVLSLLPATLKRFFLVSSTSVYPQQNGEWVDEQSPVAHSGFAARALLAGEQHALNGALPASVIRLSGIYGPGRDWLVRRAKADTPVVKEPPKWTNRIHRDDAVGFLVHLLERVEQGQEVEPLYLATDSHPATEWEVMSFLHQQLGLPDPRIATAEADPKMNKRLRNTQMLASGYTLRYPSFQQGYASPTPSLNTPPAVLQNSPPKSSSQN
ncbi:NAD-dependent epimerase/dehydratase [gamma proteobacterium HdN1]|nr:NAD-dependent epimerase/dehydratase [gamma proteobacterium HdN1]